MNLPLHTIVYGPQGCGKTTNAHILAAHYDCMVVFEADGMSMDDLRAVLNGFEVPALLLTNKDLSETHFGYAARVVSFTDAMEDASRWYLCAGDEPPNMTDEERTIYDGVKALCSLAHRNAQKWYFDPATGEPIERNFGEVVALMHSELSEALEHHRKGTQDDKLPDRPGPEVEFGDLFVRCADTSGHRGYDLAGAIIAKMRFNAIRPDHRPENRAKAGGKAY